MKKKRQKMVKKVNNKKSERQKVYNDKYTGYG